MCQKTAFFKWRTIRVNHASEAIEFERVSAAYMRCRRCGKLVLERLTARHNCHAFEVKLKAWAHQAGWLVAWVMGVNDGIGSDARRG